MRRETSTSLPELGLGLYHSKKILAALGGTLRYRKVQNGSKVSVILNLKPASKKSDKQLDYKFKNNFGKKRSSKRLSDEIYKLERLSPIFELDDEMLQSPALLPVARNLLMKHRHNDSKSPSNSKAS